ncbi:MAG TPA: GNAT family N-acetyltransferase [Devosia sp.]|nr:GNAT family N-acetyltransferase [Devosia sp.]
MIIEATASHFALLRVGNAPDGLRLPPDDLAPDEVIDMLGKLADSIRPHFEPNAWIIVEDDEIVGLCSMVRAPELDGTHVGYGVAPSRWGLGIATRAIADLLAWARSEPLLDWIGAETGVDNIASQRVLEHNGFQRIGTRIDNEDGPLLCWRANTKL